MINLMLVRPSEEHAAAVWEYRSEFLKNGEHPHGAAAVETFQTYESWLAAVLADEHEETVQEGFVPATTFLAIKRESGRLVGIINVRHYLNDGLLQTGGNIGYSVRKTERQKGYAKEMLRLALRKAQALGMERALITCNKDNIASAKTIMANGGVLENEVPYSDGISQRYWVQL